MELTIQQVQVLVPLAIKVRAEHLVAEAHVAVKILIGHHNILGSISATNVPRAFLPDADLSGSRLGLFIYRGK